MKPKGDTDMKQVSTKDMIIKLRTAHKDLSTWEQSFLQTVSQCEIEGKLTSLSGPQVEKLEEVFKRHFS